MAFVVKEGDSVILDNDEIYTVEMCVTVDNEDYLIVKKLNPTFNSMLELKEPKVQVVKEIVDENDDYFLQAVTDMEILQKVKKFVND